MKKYIGILFTFIICFICVNGEASDYAFTYGTTFSHFNSDEGEKGTQFYIPVSFSGKSKTFSFHMATAAGYSTGETASGEDATLTAVSDILMGISYFPSFSFPVDILFFLDMNIPTGKNNLSSKEAEVFADTFLYSLKPCGEGFNLNPGIVIAKGWNKWSAGAGVSYNIQGEYDYSTSLKEYQPGDIFLVTVNTRYQASNKWETGFFGEFGSFGKDKIEGTDIYQQGDVIRFGGDLLIKSENWETRFLMSYILRTKIVNDEEVLTYQDGEIVKKDDSVTGNELITELSFLRYIGQSSSLRVYGQLHYIDENNYDPTSPVYFGKREKYTLGGDITKSFFSTLEGVFFVKVFQMDADQSYLNEKETEFIGITAGINITRYF